MTIIITIIIIHLNSNAILTAQVPIIKPVLIIIIIIINIALLTAVPISSRFLLNFWSSKF